ncbi:hypothetical protein CCHR01_08510 [Colletotrichum chrysophilum]|uniref:Uncharacterized protein n=1 Tax=Colletotrichum chrysophilum TaxID=1836956 RepID=A0AAD9AIT4_9PEZI|nr:hypothetical protein CCHR01_08510 [Colletotrichum chrysophilum]
MKLKKPSRSWGEGGWGAGWRRVVGWMKLLLTSVDAPSRSSKHHWTFGAGPAPSPGQEPLPLQQAGSREQPQLADTTGTCLTGSQLLLHQWNSCSTLDATDRTGLCARCSLCCTSLTSHQGQ